MKPREAINYFQNNIKSTQDLQFKGSIEIDSPNKNIYCIGGCIIKENQEKIYFDISNCLLRGGVLKNVKCVYGFILTSVSVFVGSIILHLGRYEIYFFTVALVIIICRITCKGR